MSFGYWCFYHHHLAKSERLWRARSSRCELTWRHNAVVLIMFAFLHWLSSVSMAGTKCGMDDQ